MKLGRSLSLSLMLLTIASLVKGEDVVVTVEQGSVMGTTATSVYNTSFTAFLGIPYAVPPLGDLRFQAPQPAGSWEGTLNATQYPNNCIQQFGRSGSEDCLYLNVFVPGVPEEGANLPVMLWIYGGGYRSGSASNPPYGPDFLVSYDVILVSFNYRLGQLGFLSTGDAVAPGNAGHKDQALAMSWVKNNIASFGGDPERITIFGQSAGSMSISMHLVSTLSAGLYSQVIMQSGTVITEHPIPTATARTRAFRLGAALGYETDDSQQLLEYLQSVNATDLLVSDSLIMTEEEQKPLIGLVWGPCIEPDLEGAFLSESYIQLLIDGRINQVPIMTGSVSEEDGNVVDDADLIASLNDDYLAVIAPCIHLPTVEQQTEAALKLKDFYFGNDTISADNLEPIAHFYDDLKWYDPNDAFIKNFVEHSNETLYYYVFDYRGDIVKTNTWGVSHAGELPVIFYDEDTDYNFDPDSDEDKVRRNMLRLWTNFAKYGNPTPEPDPVVWDAYDEVNRPYLLMQVNFTLEHNRIGERMDFWRENVPLLPYPDGL